MSNTPNDALAKLRHLYANMMQGSVRDTASAKRIAEGLLAPAIELLERGAAPQPVVREPLTANQVSGLAESAGYWHGDMSRADFINGIRYAEAAHGIKGGQHGTE